MRHCLTLAGLLLVDLTIASGQTISTTTVDFGSGVSGRLDSSQAIVSGNPAVAYYDDNEHRLKFARNSISDGSGTWTVTTVDSSGDVGQFPSLAIVSGNPAIAYYDVTNGDLKFARNSAADGSGTWTIATVDAVGNVGQFVSLAIANGNPAVSYYDVGSGNLMFARAPAADGSGTWTKATLDSTGDVGQYTSLFVLVTNGRPAISYYDAAPNTHLKFIRALDTSGTTWATPVTADSAANVGQHTSLSCLFTTNPAIAYYDAGNGNLKYARNALADGSGAWTLATIDGSANIVGQYASLNIVGSVPNRFPAISYYDATNGDLKFIVALDTSGASWPAPPAAIDSTANVGQYTSLAIIGGTPAIIYFDFTNGVLKFARNSAANGSGTWAFKGIDNGFGFGNVGQFTSQAIVNGNPAISYYDVTNSRLKFARNSAADGSGTWITSVVDPSPSGQYSSLAVVNGNPAIAYQDGEFFNDPKFTRSSDVNGATGTWTITSVIGNPALTAGSSYCSLAVVNGYPAIAYGGTSATSSAQLLCFARGSDINGGAAGTWNMTTVQGQTGYPYKHTSLAVVNGNPAISYWTGNGGLMFTRSDQPDGNSPFPWPAATVNNFSAPAGTSLSVVAGKPAIAYSASDGSPASFAVSNLVNGLGSWTSRTVEPGSDSAGRLSPIAIVNGASAIAYFATNADLKFAINSAADGSGDFTTGHGAWTKATVDSAGNVGDYPSLITLTNGKPAVSYYDATHGTLKWATFSLPPEIAIERLGSVDVSDGGSTSITAAVGYPQDLNFTVRNYGIENLTGLTVAIDGANASDFSVAVAPVPPVNGPLGGTPLTIHFAPTTPISSNATKTAAVHITSNDADENSYDINLTGTSLSFTPDTDGDGMNDASEFQMAALGFDYTVAQPNLVNTLSNNIDRTGIVQALYVNQPLISKNSSGQFKLTIGVQKTTNLMNAFQPFPMSAPQTTINANGELEFQFTTTDPAAFFLLQAR